MHLSAMVTCFVRTASHTFGGCYPLLSLPTKMVPFPNNSFDFMDLINIARLVQDITLLNIERI